MRLEEFDCAKLKLHAVGLVGPDTAEVPRFDPSSAHGQNPLWGQEDSEIRLLAVSGPGGRALAQSREDRVPVGLEGPLHVVVHQIDAEMIDAHIPEE